MGRLTTSLSEEGFREKLVALDISLSTFSHLSSVSLFRSVLREMPPKVTETAFHTDLHLRQTTGPLLDKIRRLALRRGFGGLRDLAVDMKVNLSDMRAKEVKLNQDEFRSKLQNFGILLTTTEQNLLNLAFKDAIGYICVTTFCVTVMGVLNERRQKIVDRAFQKIDTTGNGLLEIDDIRDTFDASSHPKVKDGTMSEDQVLRDFLEVFEAGESKDGIVTPEEFNAYYAGLGLSIADDAYFEAVVTKAWKLDEPQKKKEVKSFIPDATSHTNRTAASSTTKGLDPEAALLSPSRRLHQEQEYRPRKIAGYTGHLPNAQERHGETFSQVEAAVKVNAPKPKAWLQGTYVDDKNAFVRKGGKANAHNFKLA